MASPFFTTGLPAIGGDLGNMPLAGAKGFAQGTQLFKELALLDQQIKQQQMATKTMERQENHPAMLGQYHGVPIIQDRKTGNISFVTPPPGVMQAARAGNPSESMLLMQLAQTNPKLAEAYMRLAHPERQSLAELRGKMGLTEEQKAEATDALEQERRAKSESSQAQLADQLKLIQARIEAMQAKAGSTKAQEQERLAGKSLKESQQHLAEAKEETEKKQPLLVEAKTETEKARTESEKTRGVKLKAETLAIGPKPDTITGRALDKFVQGQPLSTGEQALVNVYTAKKSKGSVGAAGPSLSQDTLTSMARQYLAGDTSVFHNLGRGAQGAENISALRTEIAKIAKERGLTGEDIAATNAEYFGTKAGERALGTRAAAFGMAGSEAMQMADLVLDASDKFDRTSFPALNRALQAAETGTGDPNTVVFGAALNSFINAYARAISPSGVPTVSDKDHAREMLSMAHTKEQVRAIIDQLKKEMEAAGRAPGMVRKEMRSAVTGKEGAVKSPRSQADAEALYNQLRQLGKTKEQAYKIMKDQGF